MLAGLALFILLSGYGCLRTIQISRKAELDFPPIGRFVEVDGQRIHLIDEGPRDAPPYKTIILLHGASANLRDLWFSLGQPLSADHRVIAIDRPGHGYSTRIGGRADAQLSRQADLVAALLTQLGVQSAVILAHSWSGALAMRVALDHADRAEALILLSPVTHPWPGGVDWYYTLAAMPILGNLFVNVFTAPIGSLRFDSALASVFHPAEVPSGYLDATGARLVLRPAEFKANAEDVKDLEAQIIPQSKRYAALTLPVLILTGDSDGVVSPQIHSESTARDIASARLVVLKGAGHAPHRSRTEDVVRETKAFLDNLAQPAHVR